MSVGDRAGPVLATDLSQGQYSSLRLLTGVEFERDDIG
jgi:hypothetical protein